MTIDVRIISVTTCMQCATVTTSAPGCVFNFTAQDYQKHVDSLANNCQACKQSSDSRCTKAALTKLIGASSGTVKVGLMGDKRLKEAAIESVLSDCVIIITDHQSTHVA